MKKTAQPNHYDPLGFYTKSGQHIKSATVQHLLREQRKPDADPYPRTVVWGRLCESEVEKRASSRYMDYGYDALTDEEKAALSAIRNRETPEVRECHRRVQSD